MSYRTVDELAFQLRQKHEKIASWRMVAIACKVLTSDGRPDPSLADRIATKGYDPKRPDTRIRLGLPPICIVCGQKVKRVRQIPAWLLNALGNLQILEAIAAPKPDAYRVYARGVKRVKNAQPYVPL